MHVACRREAEVKSGGAAEIHGLEWKICEFFSGNKDLAFAFSLNTLLCAGLPDEISHSLRFVAVT